MSRDDEQTQDGPESISACHEFAIKDPEGDREVKVKAEVPEAGGVIMFHIDGYETESGPSLFELDLFEGALRLFIRSKRESQEYTFSINLETSELEDCR